MFGNLLFTLIWGIVLSKKLSPFGRCVFYYLYYSFDERYFDKSLYLHNMCLEKTLTSKTVDMNVAFILNKNMLLNTIK